MSRSKKIALASVTAAILAAALLGVGRAQPPADTPDAQSGGTAGETPADARLNALIREGATMEEIARLKPPRFKTPAEALNALKAGNARFFSGQARRPELNAQERRAQILGQTPFATVLGCSDSRVPIEIIYDQNLGDIFGIRVAGNIVETATLGSVEYAVRHLNTLVVVIMGHEGCGAVQAAMLPTSARDKEPENVRRLLDHIVPAVSDLPPIRDRKARGREAVIANVRRQVAALRQNPVIRDAAAKNRILVVGAHYDITSGIVDFLETEEELQITPPTRSGNTAAH